jgi:predicted peptidase
MGANGVWRLLTKYPGRWAGVAATAGPRPIDNLGRPEQASELLKPAAAVPMIIVHGGADAVAPVEQDRALVQILKKIAKTVKYIEVEGGGHVDVVGPSYPTIFDFFDTNKSVPSNGARQ